MTRTVIPFRRRGDKASALATFDAPAAELLADGRAATLSAAQFGAILTRLRAQRDELAAIFANLETRAPSGDTRLDTINADLSVEASKALAHIDRLIQHAETCAVTP